MFACVPSYQQAQQQTKGLEDFEFQKLEEEINHTEEKEGRHQELLREIAEYQHLAVTRKVQRRLLPYGQKYIPELQKYSGKEGNYFQKG